MVSWQVPHLSTGSGPDFNNDLGAYSNSGLVLGPGIHLSLTRIMTPSLGHSDLVSNEVYICSGLLFTISWWLLYLAKGPMPDFTNGPGNDLNSTRSLAPRRLFETDVNNDPPQAIPNPLSDGEYICSGLLLMVFWWVPNSSTVSLFLFNPHLKLFNIFTKNITKCSRLFCCR